MALGFKVLASNPKDSINRIFVWACVLTAYAAFTNLGFYVAGDTQTAQVWSQASVFWLLLIPAPAFPKTGLGAFLSATTPQKMTGKC
ncbi:hypothetical protein ACFLVR_05205 [Chloroflexota bacterium]